MNKSKIVSAVDIGSSKIVTLVSQVSLDQNLEKAINVVGVNVANSKGVKKGQIVDIEETVERVTASIEGAERMAGYNLDRALVSIGGAHISSQNSRGVVAISHPDGEVQLEDVDRVIDAAKAVSLPSSREIIHVIPREYTVDGEGGIKDPIGMTGVRLEVETHLITASSPALKNLTKTVGEVGVDIEEVIFSGLASACAVLTPTEKELGVVVVDIGGGVTSIAAFLDGSLSYSGAIPIGSNNVTNDLAIGLRVSLESAEKIKISLSEKSKSLKTTPDVSDVIDIKEMGASEAKKISKKTLIEGIVRPRLNEIFTMVRLELERVGIANKIPSGVVLTGGGSLTVGVVDSARKMLSLPARIGVPGGVSGLIDDIISPPFAAVIGLIICAAELQAPEASMSFVKKFRLPTKGFLGKIIESFKDLLP